MNQTTLHETELFWKGPDFSEGSMPALFYFSLSGEESLTLDPFNQLVTALENEPIRIFSFDLPHHQKKEDKYQAVELWAKEIKEEGKLIENFVEKGRKIISHLYEQKLISKLAVAGLSRGAFLAAHLADKEERVKSLLGLAPMIDLAYMKEFKEIKELSYVKKAHLKYLEKLYTKHIRFYIGNRDVRVGTREVALLLFDLADRAFDEKIRSSNLELIISPSIGRDGHGTSPETFTKSASWIKKELL